MHSSDGRQRALAWRALAVAATVLLSSLAVASEIVAPAVGCNLGTTAFFDESTRCVGAGLVNGCETSRIHRLNSWRYGGRQFLFVSTMTSLSIYDVTDPLNPPQPKMIGGAYYPWGVVPPASDWDELQYDAAVADDYAYGIAMVSHYGWVSFKINNPTAPSSLSVQKAVRFAHADTSGAPRYGRLFQGSNGQWYAVGAYLDQLSNAVAIVSMGADASNPQLVRYLGSQIALAGDPLESARIGDRWWLFVQRMSAVGIVDLASATYAYEASSFATSRPIQDSFVDAASKRLYVLEQGVTGIAPMRIHVVDIATPSSPVERSVITLDLGAYTRIGGDSNVVVVAKQVPGGDPNPTMRAFSVVTPTAPVEIAAGELNLAGHPDEALNDLSVLTASNGNSRVYRAAWSIGTVTTISSACFPLPPQPAFTVANQSAANAAAATCGTADAVGFPGDAFDIHDQSSGQVASGTVKIENEAQQTVYGPVSWSSGATWTWATPAAQSPGVYTVTMTLFDQSGAPFPVSRTIRLCCNVAASITGPTEMCAGGSVTLDAGAGFAAYLWSPDGQTTRTITVSPAATTSYTVAVTTAVGCAATSAGHSVAVIPPPAPSAPAVAAPARAHAGDTYEVTWAATGSSGSYEVEEATDPGFAGAVTFAMAGTSGSFSHHGVGRAIYYYRARAVDACSGLTYISPWSDVALVIVVPKGVATPGLYRATDRSWYLHNSNAGGGADLVFAYGDPSDQAVKGDWDGDGTQTVGVFRDGTFYLRNSNSAGDGDVVFAFGKAGDIPIAGDWDGDGVDTIGVYRPATAEWYLKNSNAAGAPDLSFTYGLANETPVTGDWDGDGIDTVGIFRASDRQWYLHNSNAGGNAELVFPYGDPAQDVPVVGDWDGDGDDTVGIYRASLGEWFLKNTNEAGFADLNFTYGLVNEKPLAGDWDGN